MHSPKMHNFRPTDTLMHYAVQVYQHVFLGVWGAFEEALVAKYISINLFILAPPHTLSAFLKHCLPPPSPEKFSFKKILHTSISFHDILQLRAH